MYCDPASKISEFSTNESKGWKMVHLLEQPPTRLTIKGNFKVGDDVRFVPLNEPCTYGNSNNEHVDSNFMGNIRAQSCLLLEKFLRARTILLRQFVVALFSLEKWSHRVSNVPCSFDSKCARKL